MANAPFLSRAQALFSAGLLHHELHKLLKGQRGSVEAFEWESFEQLGANDEQPRARGGRQLQGDPLAGQGLSYIIVFQIDAHQAPARDGAHQHQAVARLQPAIRIDQVGHGWHLWQAGKGAAWGLVATTASLMGPLEVVVLLELRGHRPHVLQGQRPVQRQALFLIAAMIALHNR